MSKLNFKSIVKGKVIAAAQVNKILVNGKKQPLNCRIVLDANNNNEFKPGDEVRGRVDVTYNEEISFCGLQVSLEGSIQIKYIKNDRKYERKVSNLTQTEYVTGGSGPKKINISPGVQSYAFTLNIPSDNVPGSFTSEFGQVSYRISVYADYGNEKLVKRSCKQIMIKSYRDLDPEDPNYDDHIIISQADFKSCRQISYNKKSMDLILKFTFELNRGFYICGEDIPFELTVDNPKNRYKVSRINVILLHQITYFGSSKHITWKTTRHTLASVDKKQKNERAEDSANNNNKKCWKGTIGIPKGLIPNQKNVLIEIQYFLKVNVSMGKTPPESLSEECEITIATTREGLTADDEIAALKFYASKMAEKNNETNLDDY